MSRGVARAPREDPRDRAPDDDRLSAARRSEAEWRQNAAAQRREADRANARLKRAEAARDALALRVSQLVAGNKRLHSELTSIITVAEGGGGASLEELARRARRARSRLPKDGL